MADDLCFDIRNARNQIDLQSASDSRDSGGGVDRSWSTYASVYAKVEPVSARERRMAQQAELEISHRIEIRYRSDVDHGDRILLGSREFSIVGIRNPMERNVLLRIDALEKRPSTGGL